MRRLRPALVSLSILTFSFLGLQACGSDSEGGTAPVTVASVTVTGASASIEVGESTQFSATVTGSNGSTLAGRTITWGSSDSGVASVNSSGLVTGVATGTATITATVEGVVGGAPIAVTEAVVDAVEITPADPTVEVGQTVQLTATPVDARGDPLSGRPVTWESADEDVATVNDSGLVTGVAAGDVLIRAASEGVVASITLTVVPRAVASVAVDPATAEVDVGGTVQLTATTSDSDGNVLTGRTVAWATSDVAVATVSETGLVTGVAAGTATITATSEGQSGGAAVTVTLVSVGSVELSTAGDATTLEEGATLQATAVVKDTEGNVLEGRTVNWSTSDAAVATVGSDGLITGVAAGDVTITAESGGESATVDLTVVAPSFEPEDDTNVGGEVDVHDFTVPAGVTVTVTEDLVINADGDFTIDGTLEGNCVNVTLNGAGALDVTGTIDNECAEDTEDAPDISLVGNGTMALNNATFITSGSLEVKNDPTLTEEEFADLENGALSARAALPRMNSIFPCTVNGVANTRNRKARDGRNTSSVSAPDGGTGRTTSFYCSGDVTYGGGTEIDGEDGGNGGEVDNTDDPSAGGSAAPGRGGNGGPVRLRSRGNITFSGSGGGTTLNLADGGNGGTDTKVGNGPGASATATGAQGGDSGTFSILARGGIDIGVGGLTIRMGSPGLGGDADATGQDGLDAGTSAAQNGGSATAIGGLGGSHPEGRLRATGNVTGESSVILVGGEAGAGGDASATAGKGGDGNEEFPPGAEGGAMSATGGMGGDAPTKNLAGNLFADGGIGGSIFFLGGNGGNGFSDCVDGDFKPGGAGGKGGDGTGEVGVGGTGLSDGDNGSVTAGPAGNGGNGGNGQGPGAEGAGGEDTIDQGMKAKSRTDIPDLFEDGTAGDPCTPPVEVKVDVASLPNTGGLVTPGTHMLPLLDVNTNEEIGTIPFSTTGSGGANFVGFNPDRVGATGPDGWEIGLGSIVSSDPEFSLEMDTFDVCVINTTGATVENPIRVVIKDAEGNELSNVPWPTASLRSGQANAGDGCTRYSREQHVAAAYLAVLLLPDGVVGDFAGIILRMLRVTSTP